MMKISVGIVCGSLNAGRNPIGSWDLTQTRKNFSAQPKSAAVGDACVTFSFMHHPGKSGSGPTGIPSDVPG